MEENDFNKLVENLNSAEKVAEATTKEVDAKEIHKKFKEYYYRISHDEYYAAKKVLDDNVILKKKLRDEMKIIEDLKDKPTLVDEERDELKRIQKIIEDKDNIPDSKRIVSEKISKIENDLKDLKAIVNNS